MRYYFGLTVEDVIKSASYVHWHQLISKNDNMWDLAAEASENLRSLKGSFEGVKYWFKRNHGLPLHPQFAGVSSIGVVDLDDSQFGGLRINDFRFSMTRPQNNVAETEQDRSMTTAYLFCFTFRGRIKFVLTYAFPSLSQHWAQHFNRNFTLLLEQFTANSFPFFLGDAISELDKFKDE